MCPPLITLISIVMLATAGPETDPLGAKTPNPKTRELANEIRNKGWIVYSARSNSGDWDLFLTRPDGSSVRNITNTPTVSEAAPRFSNDGKKLLYRQLRKEAKIDHDKWGFQGWLVMAEPDGRQPQRIGEDGQYAWASWGPEGKRIACLTLKGIEIIDLDSKKIIRKIPRKGIYQQLGWSADGKWFCGVSNHFGENWTVVRMNVDTGEINPVNSFQNCTPDWFPDSRRIIFSHRPANQDGYGWTQLWMADGDGQNRRLVYGRDGSHVYGGAVSPDGKYILFTACDQDGGGAEKDGAPMRLIRLADAPTIEGESPALRKIHPDTTSGPVLALPIGWEPHWTDADISLKKAEK